METSSELSDADYKLQAGLQRFSSRRLVAVQSGQGADRKTGPRCLLSPRVPCSPGLPVCLLFS